MALEYDEKEKKVVNDEPYRPADDRPAPTELGSSKFSFANDTMMSGLMSSTSASMDIVSCAKLLNEVFKENPKYDVKLLTLDNETSGLAYSTIVLGVNDKSNANRVAVVPLLVANSGPEATVLSEIPTNRALGSDKNTPAIVQVPSDAVDDRFYDVIHHYTNEAYNNRNEIEFFSLDAIVLYSNIDMSDKDKVLSIAAIALNACAWELVLTDPTHVEPTIREAMAMGNNMSLAIDVHADRGTILNEVQKPIRRGFMVDMAVKDNTHGENVSINQKHASRLLNRTIGFVDVMPVVQNFPNGMGGSTSAIRYRPHVIIDNISPRYYIPSYLFMGIANALTLRSNNLWMHMLRPSETDDIHDPGCLNYLANVENNASNVGEKIDFFSNDLSAYDVNSALKTMFIDDIVFSIDIDVYGPQTWFTAMLAAAASTNGNSAASNLVSSTLDHMTEGAFNKLYSGPIFSSAIRLPTGTWVDKNGTTRDLREFDFMAVATLCGKDQAQLIQEWAASELTMANNYASMITRLEILKTIIPTAKIDSWIIRATFSTGWLMALEKSFTDCGYGANVTTPTVVQGVSPLNAIGDFMSSAVIPQGDTGFARNSVNTNGYNTYWSTPGSHRTF